jgi:hypothetical protein
VEDVHQTPADQQLRGEANHRKETNKEDETFLLSLNSANSRNSIKSMLFLTVNFSPVRSSKAIKLYTIKK